MLCLISFGFDCTLIAFLVIVFVEFVMVDYDVGLL